MNNEIVSIRKLYNEFFKNPEAEKMSYSYFKYFLMKRLEKAKAPGMYLVFTFGSGYHNYFTLKVRILEILRAMKISKDEWFSWYRKHTKNYPGVLYE